MRSFIALGAAALAIAPVLASPFARAQTPGPVPSTELKQEMKRARAVAPPPPSPEIAARDADRAATEMRNEQVLRDVARSSPNRPDLGYDVKSGIQSQNLNRALAR
ncbi:MAG: hypothetical protein HY294_10695 [Candidatus Rokubacteria bacterium]|nr:hypothetical protein [Candidatus Rokubacteria bacterium]MBI3826452.1 hypothetical protein [Candidatus Rokubacteria bacterium]